MFYYLDGTVAEILPYLAVIDCGGVGYTSAEVAQALKGVDVETLSLEEIIRQCLKKMVK